MHRIKRSLVFTNEAYTTRVFVLRQNAEIYQTIVPYDKQLGLQMPGQRLFAAVRSTVGGITRTFIRRGIRTLKHLLRGYLSRAN